MASNSYKNPPKFNSDTDPYETWRKQIDLWKLVTDLDTKKRALAAALSPDGRAKEKCFELDTAVLNSVEGMTQLLDPLNGTFKKSSDELAYQPLMRFKLLKRNVKQTMADYVLNFEERYSKIKLHKMAIGDSVLAAELIHNASIDERERKMILASTAMIYDDVK